MTEAFELVRSKLLECTPEERNKLKLLLTKHPGTAVKKTADSVNEVQADWLLQGILSELKRRGHKHHIEHYAQIRAMGCGDFDMVSIGVRRQLEAEVQRKIASPTRNQMLTFGATSARCLADYFEPKMPIALKPMLQVAGRTAEAIEFSFPGYLGCGMVSCLIDQRF